MKQPMPSDYGLTESKIEQIRSLLRDNEGLKDRYKIRLWIVACIVSVAILWPFCKYVSFFVGPLLMFCWLGWLVNSKINSLADKHFKEKALKIEGASSLKEYEFQLAGYKGYKERERIKEREKKAKEIRIQKEALIKRLRKKYEYWIGLSPQDFEHEVAELLESIGYYAKRTPATGDGGVDIILSKKGRGILVQCKKYSSKVGPAPVRELYGVMISRGVKDGWVVGLSGFTDGARKFAEKHGIRLVDVIGLCKLAGELPDAEIGFSTYDDMEMMPEDISYKDEWEMRSQDNEGNDINVHNNEE